MLDVIVDTFRISGMVLRPGGTGIRGVKALSCRAERSCACILEIKSFEKPNSCLFASLCCGESWGLLSICSQSNLRYVSDLLFASAVNV